ncbi:2-hydroxyacid dehydrogenase [Comamonas aquatica]|uniref:2-hydroxyacid dehydrogenase n=1 Tax=Comamonas aquatica TaxID=225991 RepID=UPI0022DE340D|nr:2-hydroxyacid dehydrogenase [Comamonas aquatica]MDH1901706.1 2-hydroxyacid dehydrogenase [Comamonas aquatica]WBM41571.1 2-hydroxyacid dehydrogenase [Comamonas aquatica]
MPNSKPLLLILHVLSEAHRDQLGAHFEVLYAPDSTRCAQALAAHGPRVQAVLTVGAIGLSTVQMQAMPQLRWVGALGAGYENIDVAYARAHGIAVSNGAGTNDQCVADHAFGLVIAAMRGLVRLDRLTRQGVWRNDIPLPPNVSGKRLGILGLGTIGQKIARRAQAFDMPVGYHNRRPKDGVDFTYFDSVLALAQWADVLLVATPGGAGTRHLVDAPVIAALGSQGYVVNIARGSVVDTAALAQALRTGALAGAGLDVYESEPLPPAELLDLDNVVLTPHVAGWSPEAVQATVDLFLDNAHRHFAGQPLVTPV